MKRRCMVFVVPVILLLTMFLVNTLLSGKDTRGLSKEKIVQKTQKIRIPFIANEGQTDEKVAFYANTFGGSVFVTKDGEIVYSLPTKSSKLEIQRLESKDRNREANGFLPLISLESDRTGLLHVAMQLTQPWISRDVSISPFVNEDRVVFSFGKEKVSVSPSARENEEVKAIILKEELVGGKINTIQGIDKAVTKVNCFKGKDTSNWKTNISTYDVVTLGEVYEGIELKLKAYGNNVEKLFCVKPEASLESIQVRLSGAKTLRVNNEGQLEAETVLGTVKFTKPVAYQEINGKKVEVAVEYNLSNPKLVLSEVEPSEIQNLKSDYGFKVAAYDRTKELVIDPLLASTYLGGSKIDESHSIAINTSGDIYVAGSTYSPDFPTILGAYDISFNGDVGNLQRTGDQDAFISRLSGDLTNLLASTYLGGSDEDIIYSITIDSDGNIYAGGETSSANFPTISGAYDTSYNGNADAFVLKLNGNLTNLLASTYLGGFDWEECSSITIDPIGNIYLAGMTYSTNFPTTPGAYDTSYNGCGNGCGRDAFISKLNGDLTSLLASTYLGGFYDDGVWHNHSMVINTGGDIYVAGRTYSLDFPTTFGSYDTSYNGDGDAFVSRLNGNLTNLLTSTYVGGTADDLGLSITIDAGGNIYLAGTTYSIDFPTIPGDYDTSYGGNGDAYVSKLSADLTTLIASTYLGGSSFESLNSETKDLNGNIYVAGHTYSIDFPTTFVSYDISYNGDSDAFVSKFNENLTSLIASTYLGGTYLDTVSSIAINSGGKIYVAGHTGSSDFPTTSGAYDQSHNGIYDIFISKLDSNLSDDTTPPTISSTNPANNTTDVAVNSIITATFSEDMDASSINDTTFTVSGVTGIVAYDGTTATLTPSSPLAYSSTYTTTITMGVMDVAGNHMVSDYTWSFITESLPSSPIPTPSITQTPTPVPTVEVTLTPTPTHTHAPTPTPTSNPTPTPLITPRQSPTPITSPTPRPTPTGVASPTPLPSPTAETGMIYGFVYDENKCPLRNVSISLTGSNDYSKSTKTDKDGYYEFKDLASSNYKLTYEKGGYKTHIRDVTLGEGEIRNIGAIIMKKSQTGKIYGYVIDAEGNPIQSVKLQIKGEKTKIKKTIYTDADGFFEFKDLEADTYEITAKKKYYKKTEKKIVLGEGEKKEVEIVMEKINMGRRTTSNLKNISTLR